MDGVWLLLLKPKALLHELGAELLACSPEELVGIANEQFRWCDAEVRRALRELDSDDWKRPWSTSRPSRCPGEQTQLVVEPREGPNFVREHQCNYFVGALQLFELRRETVLQQGKMTTRPAVHSQAAECCKSENPTPKGPVPAYSPT
ncbi:hypothetical protein PLICBS_006541 [Purpureocillium lilacinum]|uniref:uncharacterized protein n=1 Tax=Purpureocillium lilacinum TaxID=33203 RepID=UPI00207EF158|nr:hypothetical protein PLICBS_006541 [Purpureocillium lilacinum]